MCFPVPSGFCKFSPRDLVRDAIENSDFNVLDLGSCHVITSPRCGAGAIIKAQEWLSEHYPDGYFAIPASVNEFIVGSKHGGQAGEMMVNSMLRSMNSSMIAPTDVLSDKVYSF